MSTMRMLVAVAVAGVVAAGGSSAFTASADLGADQIVGYGTTEIDGATASSLAYEISTDGKTIEAVDMVFLEDLTGRTVRATFNDGTLTSCDVDLADGHNVTCSGLTQDVESAVSFAVSVA